MLSSAGKVPIHYVEHGEGVPVVVLHGAGVDHREPEACFEPALSERSGFRRLYPDLPGMGRTPAPDSLSSAADVLDSLLAFVDEVAGAGPLLLAGHSAGAYYARALADHRRDRVRGLALVCPLVDGIRDVPEHHAVIADDDLGDEEFRGYFVMQTPAMLDRHERFVAPAVPLADQAALERIGGAWSLEPPPGPSFDGAVLLVAGRQDSTVGYAATVDLLTDYPRATLAVLDRAGHALPHEQPELLAALVGDWLPRTTSA